MRDDINSTKMERHQHLQLFLDLKKKRIVHSADSISYFAMRDGLKFIQKAKASTRQSLSPFPVPDVRYANFFPDPKTKGN